MAGKPNKFLYQLHDVQKRGLKAYFNMLAAGTKMQGALLETFSPFTFMPAATQAMARNYQASAEMMQRAVADYPKPSFGLHETVISGKRAAITEEVVLKKDFGSLLHFKRNTGRSDPKVLIVSAMSGHYATIFRDTVAALLPNHDVYIVDWENARDVPLSKGNFGLDDYVRYVQEFIKAVGPETNVIAVSQSTVPALAAVALMAAEDVKEQPLSLTLMCGPVDARVAETPFMSSVRRTPLNWFSKNVITTVPQGYKGAGRSVYPGFLQLAALTSARPHVHALDNIRLFNHLSQDDKQKADKIKKSQDETLSVSDAPDKFYLDTIERIFMKHELANGTMIVNGKKVEPAKIKKTALFTIEGAADSLTPPGQTAAAHLLCSGLSAEQHAHHLQQGADHYDLIGGRLWREGVLPHLTSFIRKSAEQRGLKYDPAAIGKPKGTGPDSGISILQIKKYGILGETVEGLNEYSHASQ